MHRSLNEPPAKPELQDEEQPDDKVVRLMPRRRPGPEQLPEPATDDDDDPGPSAA